jgi:ferric-dicitrate binding protein FerR (iron transport regulator)
MEGFLYLGGWRMRRCHECDFRFAQIGCSPVHLSDLRRLARRAVFAIVAMAAIAAMATMLAAVIWLGPHPANGPGHAATSSAPAQRAEGFT